MKYFLLLFLLAGCATTDYEKQKFINKMQNLVTEKDIIMKYGAPANDYKSGDIRILVYNFEYGSSTNSTYLRGTANSVNKISSTEADYCTIQFFLDKSGNVLKRKWNGNSCY